MTRLAYTARWLRLVRRYHDDHRPPPERQRHGSAVLRVLLAAHPVRSGRITGRGHAPLHD